MNYHISKKRRQQDIRQTNWKERFYIVSEHTKGRSFAELARELGKTRQAVYQQYKRMDNLGAKKLGLLLNMNIIQLT